MNSISFKLLGIFASQCLRLRSGGGGALCVELCVVLCVGCAAACCVLLSCGCREGVMVELELGGCSTRVWCAECFDMNINIK